MGVIYVKEGQYTEEEILDNNEHRLGGKPNIIITRSVMMMLMMMMIIKTIIIVIIIISIITNLVINIFLIFILDKIPHTGDKTSLDRCG